MNDKLIKPEKYIIGIDEVGRGPLAGPVVVVAVAVRHGLKIGNRKLIGKRGLKDSKQLTAIQREKWSAYLRSRSYIRYAVCRVNPKTIDRINISRAANLAAFRAFDRLVKTNKLTFKSYSVYLDGGLYLKNKKKSGSFSAQTVIKGDEKITAIKAASIIAKVSRDKFMVRLAKQYPEYGFEKHKGYGTKNHKTALYRHGASNAHRASFLGFLGRP